MRTLTLSLLFAAGLAFAGPADPTVAQMQGTRRILIVSAPAASDSQYEQQLRLFSEWQGSQDRDLSLVRIEGDISTGTRDSAVNLRRQFGLPAGQFAAVLVGKDGHVALRSDRPLSGAKLQGVIDAMPMRRAGQR